MHLVPMGSLDLSRVWVVIMCLLFFLQYECPSGHRQQLQWGLLSWFYSSPKKYAWLEFSWCLCPAGWWWHSLWLNPLSIPSPVSLRAKVLLQCIYRGHKFHNGPSEKGTWTVSLSLPSLSIISPSTYELPPVWIPTVSMAQGAQGWGARDEGRAQEWNRQVCMQGLSRGLLLDSPSSGISSHPDILWLKRLPRGHHITSLRNHINHFSIQMSRTGGPCVSWLVIYNSVFMMTEIPPEFPNQYICLPMIGGITFSIFSFSPSLLTSQR